MEEILKIEDLMVNDIVLAEAIWYDEETGKERREWHPLRITTARKWDMLESFVDSVGEWLDDCYAEIIGNVKCMPLTPEILEANGWQLLSNYDREAYYDPNGVFSLDFRNGLFRLIIHGNIVVMEHVHELQDTLRVCKLKSLANNFKIE